MAIPIHIDGADEPVDYELLDAGIRRTVRLLRDNGFRTCDSGDGTKAAEMDCAVGYPMVAMLAEPGVLVAEADRLHALMLANGIDIREPGPEEDDVPVIDASYDPASRVAVIVLVGVADHHLPDITRS